MSGSDIVLPLIILGGFPLGAGFAIFYHEFAEPYLQKRFPNFIKEEKGGDANGKRRESQI